MPGRPPTGPGPLLPARTVTFTLTVQTANTLAQGESAGAPQLWALSYEYQAIRASGTPNTGIVWLTIGGQGKEFPLTAGTAGATDVPTGFAIWIGDMGINGANVGDSICVKAVVVD